MISEIVFAPRISAWGCVAILVAIALWRDYGWGFLGLAAAVGLLMAAAAVEVAAIAMIKSRRGE